jgi:O-antigen ligase
LHPFYSFYRGIEYLFIILAILICIEYHEKFESAEKKVLLISSIVILLTILGHIRLAGFSLSLKHWHTNSYTASSAMVFCYCASEYFRAEKKRKKILFYYGCFSFICLGLGTSAASNLSAAFGIFIGFILFNRALTGIIFFICIITLFLLVKPLQGELAFIYPIIFPGKTPMQIESLQGRIYLWQHALEIFKMNPLLGQGFGIVSRQGEHLGFGHLHNSIAAALVGTGIFGTILFVLYIIRIGWEIISITFKRIPGTTGCASALSAGLTNSLAMPLIGDRWEESSVVFLCFNAMFVLFVVCSRRTSEKQRDGKISIHSSETICN